MLKRPRFIVLACLLACLLALLLTVAVGLVASLGPPSGAVLDRLQCEGDAIVAQIEAYKDTNGSYPTDLATARIVVPKASYDGWQYHVRDNGSAFHLSIGDYGKYLFVLFYESKNHSWGRDA